MTSCCRKCVKVFCEYRNAIEDCEACISEVFAQFKIIDKNLVEETNGLNERKKKSSY